MKAGVIGVGTVGYPLFKALQFYHEDVVCYDSYKPSDEWSDMTDTDICFICVPTDKGKDGRLDMRHVDGTLKHLSSDGYNGLVVVKSTLSLGYITEAIARYRHLDIAVFPEWLRAARAYPDTLNPEMTVLGVQSNRQRDMMLDACIWHDKEEAIVLKPEEAAMVKLTANALAATKISFANQIMLICEGYNIDADTVMDAIKTDPRCTARYLTPGGAYGGYCLPKDTSELAHATDSDTLFSCVEEVNRKIRGITDE